MSLELDHFFILVEPHAKAAEVLIELGLKESYSRVHLGQGTTNRCFKFSNSMLELLWLSDESEANNGPAANMQFPKRVYVPTNVASTSPFGLVFNQNHSGNADQIEGEQESLKGKYESSMPFKGWTYQPDYFPAPKNFHVGCNSVNLAEPLCIYMPFVEPMAREIEVGKFKSVSDVRVQMAAGASKSEELSDVLVAINKTQGLTIELGDGHLMEVTFDEGACGLTKDLRPALPLIVHW